MLTNLDDGAAASPDLGDMSPEGPQPPMILLQQLLSSATQPSPVKAIFDKQELEVHFSNLDSFNPVYLVVSD